jgi:PncC family amidohydrolase
LTLEDKLGRLITARGFRLALAESCTGGLIAKRITDVAGSSAYFEAGLVTYSNEAKETFLAVPHDLLLAKGAVSREVALKMAEGVRQAARVDVGLSVTGIAGPSGGTKEKPVGTVFIALAATGNHLVGEYHFVGDRQSIREQTADEALKMAVAYLEGAVT